MNSQELSGAAKPPAVKATGHVESHPILVRCEWCNKTHSALPGDAPCSPQCWREDATGLVWEVAEQLRARVQQGPRVEPEPYVVRKTRSLAALRQATWEATQYLTSAQTLEFVQGVLREVESDEP